jgi:hypothetical protein
MSRMSEGSLPTLGVGPPGQTPGPSEQAPAARAGVPVDEATPTPQRKARWRGGRRLSTGHEIYWWIEVGIVLVFDLIYESLRDLNSSSAAHAYHNALRLIGWERDLHIYSEHTWQVWTLGHAKWAIIASNYYYGAAYIAVTVSALVFLYRRFPDNYPLWRNTLAIGTLLGLIGFAIFPLMPPRLLDTFGHHTAYNYVDTLVKYPTFWSFNSSAMKSISNQYAAMPSLHCGWALWGCAVFLPRVKSWWAKGLAVLYPMATITAVVVTANHYFLDAVGGAAIFLIGYGAARLITRAGRVPKKSATPQPA